MQGLKDLGINETEFLTYIDSKIKLSYSMSGGKIKALMLFSSINNLWLVQKIFGGVARRSERKMLTLEFRNDETINLIKNLIPLKTKKEELYSIVLEIKNYKNSIDKFKIRYPDYLATYQQGLNALIEKFNKERLYHIFECVKEHKDFIVFSKEKELEVRWRRTKEEYNKIVTAQKQAKLQKRIKREEKKRAEYLERKKSRDSIKLKAMEERLKAKKEKRDERTRLKMMEIEQKRKEREDLKKRTEEDLLNGFITCIRCSRRLPVAEFNKRTKSVNGHVPYCRPCLYNDYVVPNRAKALERCKRWQRENPDTFRASVKKQNDKPLTKIRKALRYRITQVLDRRVEPNEHIEYLGISAGTFKAYLETLWQPGMSWENHGSGPGKWVIDHIIPVAAFDVTKGEHLHWCLNYRNLRPLWFRDNSEKSDLIDGLSVRALISSGQRAKLHDLVAEKLNCLGIASNNEYKSTTAFEEKQLDLFQ